MHALIHVTATFFFFGFFLIKVLKILFCTILVSQVIMVILVSLTIIVSVCLDLDMKAIHRICIILL